MNEAEFQRVKGMGEARRKCAEEGSCRVCGWMALDPHHIVYRSLSGTDDPRNILPVCRPCHDDIHAKKVDPLPHLTLEEQSYAVSLIGIERAHRLLAPSVYRSERLAA